MYRILVDSRLLNNKYISEKLNIIIWITIKFNITSMISER